MIELIDKEKLFKSIDKDKYIVVCVSTGIDSMCLFYALYNLSLKIVVAHINHKKRKESDYEYEYLKNVCEKMKVPFEGYVIEEKIEKNFQEAARKIRYDFFMKTADKYGTDQIVTAHQMDDQIETVLMRIARGTSLKGYGGIQEKSTSNGYVFYRPLLSVERSKIEEYQKENSIKYFEDSSNSENHYTRNIIRHKIVPVLRELNPNIGNSIKNYSEDLSDVYKFVRKLSVDFVTQNNQSETKDEISFDIDKFLALDRAVKREVVIYSFNLLSNDSLEVAHERINQILNIESFNSESKTYEISSSYKVSIEYGKIVFYKDSEENKTYCSFDDFGKYSIGNNKSVVLSQNYHQLPNKNSYMLCYNMEDDIFPIIIRNIENGDKITYSNITKKINDLLMEHKIPKRKRKKVLVVLNKDGIFFVPEIVRKETDQTKKSKLYITIEDDKNEN